MHAHSLAIFCAVVVVCSRCFARHGSSRRQRHSVVKSFFDTRAELSRRFVRCQRPPTNILCRNIWYSTWLALHRSCAAYGGLLSVRSPVLPLVSPVATGGFGGRRPPANKAPSPLNCNMKHYKSVEFLSNFQCQAPPRRSRFCHQCVRT